MWKSVNPNDSIPWCFVRVAKFVTECVDAFGDANQPEGTSIKKFGDVTREDAISSIIAKPDRKCPKFYPYQESLSPSEHFEDRRMRELEELRRANDLKIAEIQSSSQADSLAVAKSLEQIQRDHLEFAKIRDRDTTKYNVAFLVLALIAAILAISALAYPGGASWLDWVPGQEADTVVSESEVGGR